MWIQDWRVLISCVIAMFINVLSIASGAARVAGVDTKRLATGLTLFNVFGLVARLANIVMLPVMANLVDLAVKHRNLGNLEFQIRLVLFSAFVGSVIGGLLMPTFVAFFKRAIRSFERTTSVPRVLLSMLDPRRSSQVLEILRVPSIRMLEQASMKDIPNAFLFYNVAMTAIWAVGALAAVYASAIIPEFSRTATLLSSVVNGWATIMFALVVDPAAALISDQAVQNIRPARHVRSVVIYLTGGTIAGICLAQFLLIPATQLIVVVTRFLGGL